MSATPIPNLAHRLAAQPPPPVSLDAEYESLADGVVLLDVRSRRHPHALGIVGGGSLVLVASLAASLFVMSRGGEVSLGVCVLLIAGLGGGFAAAGLGLVALQQHIRFEFYADEVRFDRPFRPRTFWPVRHVCAVAVLSDDPAIAGPSPTMHGRPRGMTKVRLYLDDRWDDIRGGFSPAEHVWLAKTLAGALGVPAKIEAAHLPESYPSH